MRYFVATAEAGKISGASAMLGISPSAITEAIADLSALVGVKLFKRESRGVSLTFEGHRMLAQCRGILAAVDQVGLEVTHSPIHVKGRIRLALSITISGYFFPAFLTRLRQRFPDLDLEFTEADHAKIEAGLRNGTYDLGMMLVSNIKDDDLVPQTLIRSSRRLWLAREHPLLSENSISLANVAEFPYIQLTIDEAEASTHAYWSANGLKPNVVLRTASVEAIRGFVAYGVGVTILSDIMYRPWSLEGDKIEVRDLALSIPTLDVGLAWKMDRVLSQAEQTFIDFCRVECEGAGFGDRRNIPIKYI